MNNKVISLIIALVLGFATMVQAQWVSHHNMTSSSYQQKFDNYKKKGLRLVHVDGYRVGAKTLYAAIWEKKSGPAYIARHGLSAAAYQKAFDSFTKRGYRLVLVDGAGGSKSTYSAIWEKKSGPAYIARHGLTSAAYQKLVDEKVKQGFRISYVSGYGSGSQLRYACILEKKGGPAWVARHGLTASTYQTEFNKWTKKGYKLSHVNVGTGMGSSARFAAIFHKKGGAFIARHGLTSAAYQKEFDLRAKQGYKLVKVSGYDAKGSARFAALWVKPVKITGPNKIKARN
ncbi:MAG: hypothetical protein MRZ79_24295 [Bacteroidia bacterium]|nr:hypothetical protein [Bacteroidia bacterium]